MRVLPVLVALLVAPLAVSVAQGRGHDAEHCAKRAAKHPGKAINKCEAAPVTEPLPPPLPPPPPPQPLGTAGIDGMVYHNLSFSGMANWVVQLGGDVTTSVVTDAAGTYAFTGLPAGSYWVCVALPSGWAQQMPTMAAPCSNGIGYTFTLAAGELAGWVNFAVAPQ
ncbi:MAG TPA: SdrD B-like domain-containing protein [Gemmatimonadales bacterium]